MLAAGYRTQDIAGEGGYLVDTKEMTRRVIDASLLVDEKTLI